MRALITGGRGFLGRELTTRLLRRGLHVRVLDDGSGASCRPPVESVENYDGSVLDQTLVRRLLADTDVIFHLAAIVGVQRVLADPLRTYRVNFEGTRIVGEAAAELGAPVVYASSSEVYGHLGARANREADPPTTPHLPRGRSSYPVSKLAGEEYLQLLNEAHRLPLVVARLFNTVGPGQSPEAGMVLPRFVQQALSGRPLTVFGPGSQTRSFAAAGEVAEALVQLAEHVLEQPARGSLLVNLGSTREITMRALAQLVLDRTGSRSGLEEVSYTDAYGGTYHDQSRRIPDLTRLTQVLGWRPDRPLADIIDDVIAGA